MLAKMQTLRAVERVTLLRFLFVMHPYQTTLDFAFFDFRINNCEAHLMLRYLLKDQELPNDSGRLSSYNNFTDKKQNGC